MTAGQRDWPALAAATAHDAALRVPFSIAGQPAGSVAREHLGALAAWPDVLTLEASGVQLEAEAASRDAVLAGIHAALRRQGAIRGWRDELIAVRGLRDGRPLARIERAAARFWGSLTLGVHANGYVADASGQPARLWIARRALTKTTDPGLCDSLVGGGVAAGQTPWQALLREGWEEAGIAAEQTALARPGRVMRLARDVDAGLQLEDLLSHDLALPGDWQPVCQDGEVAGFECLPVAEALDLAAGPAMTVDAALVLLDFAERHHLLPPAEAGRIAARLDALAPPPSFARDDRGRQSA